MDFSTPRLQPQLSVNMTASHRAAVITNLRLELDNRINKLRAHHKLISQALRSKIEMRINRIPKRLWNKTFRELRQEKSKMTRQLNTCTAATTLHPIPINHGSKQDESIRVKKLRSPVKRPVQTQVQTQAQTRAVSPIKKAVPSGIAARQANSPVKASSPSKPSALPSFMSPTKTSQLNVHSPVGGRILPKSSSIESLKSVSSTHSVRPRGRPPKPKSEEQQSTNSGTNKKVATKPVKSRATTKATSSKKKTTSGKQSKSSDSNDSQPNKRNLRSRIGK